jgi:indole-3-glycerol phosphate synthase
MPVRDALKEIVAKKKERIAAAKLAVGEEALKERAAGLPACRPFLEALRKPRQICLIAEIKKQSPSAGVLRPDLDPAALAGQYAQAGAQAVSVITEEDFFNGSPAFLGQVRQAVNLPLLRKDFIVDPYQVLESRVLGADAILLIADILSKDMLTEFIQRADTAGLRCLVEVHDEKQLKKVLGIKPANDKKAIPFALGINNRDLHSLEVDTKTTERLFPLVPKDRLVVVESGLKSGQDILFLKVLGVSAVLVGEAIVTSADVQAAIQDLMGW